MALTWEVQHADCLEAMRELDEASVDAVVTDPPYGLGFMGKEWDNAARMASVPPSGTPDTPLGRFNTGKGPQAVAFDHHAFQSWSQAWATEALRVLKPGGHLLAFGGTRTYHRLACAVEDAGFEIRDSLIWLYGAGFPKSLNLDRLRGETFCGCEAVSEHDLRPVCEADLPPPLNPENERGEVLFAGVPQSGVPGEGAVSKQGTPDGTQPRVERWGDIQAPEGESQGSAVRPSARVGVADGAEGRLRHGASAGDGADGRAAADPDGVRSPSGSRPAEQRPRELGTLADEPRSQARGGWPVCGGCGKPRIPRGLGTALKPAHEPIVVARKPLSGTVSQNVERYGVGALNIDGCRVGTDDLSAEYDRKDFAGMGYGGAAEDHAVENPGKLGRWPANVTLSHLPECEDDACGNGCAVAELDRQSGERSYNPAGQHGQRRGDYAGSEVNYASRNEGDAVFGYGDTGGASRFFYVAKSSRSERNAGLEGFEEREQGQRYGSVQDARPHTVDGYEYPRQAMRNVHPTVKPLALMRWLVRLVCPPGGLCLDPFTGSGTTGAACVLEDSDFLGIEREAEYVEIARARIDYWNRQPKQLDLLAVASEEQG